MKIFFSILFNTAILIAIAYFLPYNEALKTGVCLGGGEACEAMDLFSHWKLFFVGGTILGLLNSVVKPLLKIIGLPFVILTFGAFILVINGIILFLLQKIIAGLNIGGVGFEIRGVLNFIIAVAIFTVFNIIYSTFLKK